MTIVVTGGAGFIGSNFIHDWCANQEETVVNVDALTYAGNRHNLDPVQDHPHHVFIHASICDPEIMAQILSVYHPRAIVHFAAESHVDRSIGNPEIFIQTNVVGTGRLLEVVRAYWSELPPAQKIDFRMVHISTDEVYGSLEPGDPPFTESHPYAPNSPYSASKAGSDHMVRAYHRTYGLPVITTHCSNNYGPYQFPEKLIPCMISKALAHEPLPVYGDGLNVRDWLYVGDHVRAIQQVLAVGQPGAVYNIGGACEKTNREVVDTLCSWLDRWSPRADGRSYTHQICYVPDRPGHDRRYAINGEVWARQSGWHPLEPFETGIAKTVRWYLDHPAWVQAVQSGRYRHAEEWVCP